MCQILFEGRRIISPLVHWHPSRKRKIKEAMMVMTTSEKRRWQPGSMTRIPMV